MHSSNSLTKSFTALLLVLSMTPPAQAGDATVAGSATASAPSSTWIAVQAPLDGDDNRNGYASFEISTGSAGPFDSAPAFWRHLPGPSEWRAGVFARGLITPGTSYFVKVTYVDTDGVTGPNPQILGPIKTPASAPNSVTVGPATADARDDEIFVSVPISDDANTNSYGSIEVATAAGGPWTRKCGGSPSGNLPFHPKRCRIRSLSPGSDYWVRVTISDADGVAGANSQILGPIRYEGLENLALGKSTTADPGWGCCPSPSHLVDGRIQNDAWFFGFAWTGGTSHWAGGPEGFKQATIDLGTPTAFDRAAVWYHDTASVPLVWKFQVSDDGTNWNDALSVNEPICRGTTVELPGHWQTPACGHDAAFPPVTARFFRFTFDDRTLFRGLHGWAVEIEIFDTSQIASGTVVTNTNDSGSGSLRQAIFDANADPASPDTIVFNIPTTDPGFDGSVFTVQPLSPLPEIRNNTTIDGTTQTAFSGDSNPLGPEVVINGALAGSGIGLHISGDGNTVKALVINGFAGSALVFARLPFDPTPSNNQLLDSYLGTDPTGTVVVPNSAGISIGGFGSPSVQARNNVVEGNLISGNSGRAVTMCDAGDTRVVNNLIGTDRTGTAPLGNGGHGIFMTCAGNPRTLIQGNTIAWNADDGVHDAPDYRFGVAFTPDGHQGNTVGGNSIFANGGLGINLLPPPFPPTEPPSTVTPNDPCDGDSGGNLLQNFPVLTRAEADGATTTIEGFLDSNPSQAFDVELFANAAADPSGFGEGQVFLTTVPVSTDSSCTGNFSVVLPTALAGGDFVTATATDAAGNTSEFSAALAVTDLSSPPALAYWPLDDGSGTIAGDSSGNGNDGTLAGVPTWIAGQTGSALAFDGGDDFVGVTDPGSGWPLDITGALTLALWVNPDALDSHKSLLSKDEVYEFELGHAGDDVYSVRLDNVRIGSGSTRVVPNTWQYLAMTWDGATVRYYYNGQPDGSAAHNGPLGTNDRDLGIGARPGGSGSPGFPFGGLLDDVRIYDHALSPEEILDLFDLTGSDFTPPLRADGAPAQILPGGTTGTTLSLSTAENAACRYSTVQNVAFADMIGTFATTGGTSHATAISGLSDNQIFTFYVRCQDEIGNANLDDFRILFAVSSDTDLAAGLLAYWALDEGSGCTAGDSAGAHDGTLGPTCPGDAPQWSGGILNSGLAFDGGDNEVLVANSGALSPLSQVTVVAWIQHDPVAQFRAIVDHRDAGTDGYDLYVDPSSRLFMRIDTATVLSDSIVAEGSWHHAVGTYDGSEIVLYVDGVRDASSAVAATTLTMTNGLRLGHHFSSPDFSLAGDLDEVRLYDRALSEIEVLELYLIP